jgi:hypothetical protein
VLAELSGALWCSLERRVLVAAAAGLSNELAWLLLRSVLRGGGLTLAACLALAPRTCLRQAVPTPAPCCAAAGHVPHLVV